MSNNFNELELYKAFFEDAHVSFWVCDKDLKVVLWNKGAENIYEYKKDEVLGKYYIDLFIDEPEQQDARNDDLATITDGFVQKNRIAYDKTKYGRTIYMLTNCFRITNKETGEVFKAELGVEISDIGLRENEHKNLRAIGEERIARQIEQKNRMTSDVAKEIQRKIDAVFNEMSEKKEKQKDWYNRLDETKQKSLSEEHDKELKSIDDSYLKKIFRLNELKNKAIICDSTTDLEHVQECLIRVIQNEEET